MPYAVNPVKHRNKISLLFLSNTVLKHKEIGLQWPNTLPEGQRRSGRAEGGRCVLNEAVLRKSGTLKPLRDLEEAELCSCRSSRLSMRSWGILNML